MDILPKVARERARESHSFVLPVSDFPDAVADVTPDWIGRGLDMVMFVRNLGNYFFGSWT